VSVLLISTYDLGRQPFGLASPAAWLRRAGLDVVTRDLSRESLAADDVRRAHVSAFYLPMHTATRLALPVIDRIRAARPEVPICAYGLYAPLNEDLLREHGVSAVYGPEAEEDLVAWAGRNTGRSGREQRSGPAKSPDLQISKSPDLQISKSPNLHISKSPNPQISKSPNPQISKSPNLQIPKSPNLQISKSPNLQISKSPNLQMPRLHLIPPDRSGLPALDRYARLRMPDGTERVAGATDATRGCKHRCRHCPIVPIYNGQFRVVAVETVLADIDQQVAAGARHITFGDPDFFNGPRHARRIVEALHARHPSVSYDVTIKIEHLLRHRDLLPVLARTGCVFVTSAVESVDDRVLARFEKHHTRADFIAAVGLTRESGLTLAPTFVAFTPWTTLDGFRDLLDAVERLDLIDHVAPVQWGLRLLITHGSRLLELPEVRGLVGSFDRRTLTFPWAHDDPRVDRLQRDIAQLIGIRAGRSRHAVFSEVSALAARRPLHEPRLDRAAIPYLDEPWYC
jgi:radical SAM superfamily enzyme YgiQ (UPF0313 family)